jgi:hypothetical protein
LPNRQYFSTSAHFYRFTDVTDKIKTSCESWALDQRFM